MHMGTISMHVPYLKNVPNPCMLHACFRNHACNMHEISNYSILLLESSCIKLSGFGHMKCAETCMKHACFRCSILSRDGTSPLYTSVRSLRDLYSLGPSALGYVNSVETCTSVYNLYLDATQKCGSHTMR